MTLKTRLNKLEKQSKNTIDKTIVVIVKSFDKTPIIGYMHNNVNYSNVDFEVVKQIAIDNTPANEYGVQLVIIHELRN